MLQRGDDSAFEQDSREQAQKGNKDKILFQTKGNNSCNQNVVACTACVFKNGFNF